jgi:hypothetical protein
MKKKSVIMVIEIQSRILKVVERVESTIIISVSFLINLKVVE